MQYSQSNKVKFTCLTTKKTNRKKMPRHILSKICENLPNVEIGGASVIILFKNRRLELLLQKYTIYNFLENNYQR